MQRRLIILASLLITLAGVGYGAWVLWGKEQAPDHPHFHAAFKVYVNNAFIDLSDAKYMHLDPCTDNEEEDTSPEHEQGEKVHLHDGVGGVVHIHRDGATWGDLFQNISYPIGTEAVGYDGTNVIPNILSQTIQPDERLVILIGEQKNLDEKLAAVPSIEDIRTVENASESCGT